jgi:hypothetical protein
MLTLQFYVLEGSARKIEFGRPDDKTRVKIFRKSCKPDTQELSDE